MMFIIQPTNMVRMPYDTTPAMIMLLVWVSSIERPDSIGKVRIRGYIEDMLTPNMTPLKQQANYIQPAFMIRRESIPDAMFAMIKMLSFELLFPGTNIRINLKMVIKVQNMVGKMVAPRLSVVLVKVAKEEIQPPQVISIPRQKNIKKHTAYSSISDILLELTTDDDLFSGRKSVNSGDFIFMKKGIESAISRPKTEYDWFQKRKMRQGPINPPTPNMPWVTSSQNSISQGSFVRRTQTFRIISRREQPMLIRESQIPSQREEVVWEKSKENMPIKRQASTSMLWLVIFLLWRYLVRKAPMTMVKERQLKRKEYSVQMMPVAAVRQGMKGPSEEMWVPQLRKVTAQREAQARCLWLFIFCSIRTITQYLIQYQYFSCLFFTTIQNELMRGHFFPSSHQDKIFT